MDGLWRPTVLPVHLASSEKVSTTASVQFQIKRCGGHPATLGLNDLTEVVMIHKDQLAIFRTFDFYIIFGIDLSPIRYR